VALRHWLQLTLTEGIGPILIGRLVEAAGGAEAACNADSTILRSVEGIGGAKSRLIGESLKQAGDEVDAEIARCAAAGVTLICKDDPQYPPMLAVIPDPPIVLYVRGTLEDRDLIAIGIVGSRRCSNYGREQAERFSTLLAQAGLTVVSGGARGIDSAAHRGAMLPPEGRTIAVLGCGVDIAYPPENKGLFEQIVTRGAVISEFPLETPPMKENFPRRNRIISGLSRGVLVVESDVASGALITARQACDEHGRPVFAIPGRVDNPMSAGPHHLIREGATLVTNLEDILEGLGPLPHSATTTSKTSANDAMLFPTPASASSTAVPANGTDRQKQILSALGDDSLSLDLLISRCEIPAEIVLQELTMMSLRGMVRRIDGQTYEKGKSH
jgi:DNA processing protein